jgi:hypothetical protein
VIQVRDDGSLALRRVGQRRGAAIVIPADYAAEHLDLGYAVTSFRAQGVTTDTAHVLVDPSMTRENLYVAMTRGRQENTAYVAADKPDPAHQGPHPSDNPDATARTVLYGVLQHVGAELSAHETITAEQEAWGSIAQLAAEYETLAAAAQHDRWATLIRTSGLTADQAEEGIGSEAFGALTAELRRAEANNHNVDALMPRLVAARGFTDADDIASVLHYRLTRATERPAGAGRRPASHLIVGLIPEAVGTMSEDMRTALTERRELIETRATDLLATAVADKEEWVAALGDLPTDEPVAAAWRAAGRTVAAYRDRWCLSGPNPLGPSADTDAQKIDAARAGAAWARARQLAAGQRQHPDLARRTQPQRIGLLI